MTFYEETFIHFLKNNIPLSLLERTFERNIFTKTLSQLEKDKKIYWNGHSYEFSPTSLSSDSLLQEILFQKKLEIDLYSLTPYQVFFLKKKLEEIRCLEKDKGQQCYYFTWALEPLESLL